MRLFRLELPDVWVEAKRLGPASAQLGTATNRAITQFYPVGAIAVFGIPVPGFLPFGRCRVNPFLCGYLQSLCALAFGQLINLRINRRTEAIDVVVVRQPATSSGLCGCHLAGRPPGLFIQCRAGVPRWAVRGACKHLATCWRPPGKPEPSPRGGRSPRRVDETPRMRRGRSRSLLVRLTIPLLRLEVECVTQHTQASDL
jgi:hypothetical protein